MVESSNCSSCGSSEIFLRKKGNATGLYCLNCGKWYKWVGKKEVKVYTHRGYKVHEENYVPQTKRTESPTSLNQVTGNINLGVSSKEEDINIDSDSINYNIFEQTDDFEIEEQDNEVVDDEPCNTCITGVIDPISKNNNVVLNIFDSVMFLRTKDNSELYGSFKISYCPKCGRKI